MKKISYFIYFLFASFLMSCSPNAPKGNVELNAVLPAIFPDYIDVTIPPNIAPLNFYVEEEGRNYFVQLQGADGKGFGVESKYPSIQFNMKKWRKLVKANAGKSVSVKVLVKSPAGKWKEFKSFNWSIAKDEIDSHLAYRLINVGYVLWKKMGLYQRDLTSFNETPIMLNRNSDENCMNCHSFCNNDPGKFMFHMRAKNSGTVISTPDSMFKINSKTDKTISSGGYSSWHPDGKHIAFSLNAVKQFFHGVEKRNEIYDRASDVIVYDIERNTIITTPALITNLRESMPNWSPDGKFLYFCRTLELNDSLDYNEYQYDLLRIPFDAATNSWGEIDTVLLSNEINGTISWPKISPDGKLLLFTRATHGYFTIFNASSDLYFLDLASGKVSPYPYNSNEVESYHTWSHNSRWMVFSSKRINGLTTRPFISYIDESGKAHKPFVLPQKDPLFYRSFMTNYNVPELISGPVDLNKQHLLRTVFGKAKPVEYFENGSSNYKEEKPDSSETLIH